MNEYLQLLENMDDLSLIEKRTLLSITTYLNKEELDEFANYNKMLNISAKQSLNLENIDINNDEIKAKLLMFKKYAL